MGKENNDLLLHMVTIQIHTSVTVLSVNLRLQQAILGFASETTVKQYPGHL
jgi:hypothetical protein